MEINDYVRTRLGIDKIKYINHGNVHLEKLFTDSNIFGCNSEITKHSKDIVKLLEKGDILVDYNDNLYLVDYIDKTLVDYQIKKVLTHEQFEANSYTIEKER